MSVRVERLVAGGARQEVDLADATGVVADTNIIITFNESMNRVSVPLALQSPQISVTNEAWSEDDRVLTLDPIDELDYAKGDAGVKALSYLITITQTAEDQAGNRLPSDWSGTFTTLREVSQALTIISGTLDCRWYDGEQNRACMDGGAAGDNQYNQQHAMFVQFDLSPLPSSELVGISRATLSGTNTYHYNGPFVTLGDLHLYAVDTHPLSTAAPSSLLEDLGVFATVDEGPSPTMEIVDAFRAGYAAREASGNLVQYGLAFPVRTDGDATSDSYWLADELELTVAYLIP